MSRWWRWSTRTRGWRERCCAMAKTIARSRPIGGHQTRPPRAPLGQPTECWPARCRAPPPQSGAERIFPLRPQSRMKGGAKKCSSSTTQQLPGRLTLNRRKGSPPTSCEGCAIDVDGKTETPAPGHAVFCHGPDRGRENDKLQMRGSPSWLGLHYLAHSKKPDIWPQPSLHSLHRTARCFGAGSIYDKPESTLSASQ